MFQSNDTDSMSGDSCAETEMLLIRTELGVNSAAEVIQLVRGLRSQIQALIASEAKSSLEATAVSNSKNPHAAMSKIRDFASKVATLNGIIASMENQLMSLYRDRERLEQEIGAGEVEDVIAAFRAQRAAVLSMEQQLSTLYADREVLDEKLGRSEPKEIIDMFQSVTRLVQDAQRELAVTP